MKPKHHRTLCKGCKHGLEPDSLDNYTALIDIEEGRR